MAAFEVRAEPNRRRILGLLREQERPVGERRLYRVRAEPLQAIDEWLAPYRAMWSSRLDDLERHLDAMDLADDPRHARGGPRPDPHGT